MGLLLDTSVLIAGERQGRSAEQLLQHLDLTFGETLLAISAISVVELTHGIYRARTADSKARRRTFTQEIFRDLQVLPVTLEIALLAGRIEGEQAALGNNIAFEDLVIGATALHLGFAVVTFNTRHFVRIPGLQVVSP